MNPLLEVITVHEAAAILGESSSANIRKVQRLCKNGTYVARQDPKGTWLILKKSVLEGVK